VARRGTNSLREQGHAPRRSRAHTASCRDDVDRRGSAACTARDGPGRNSCDACGRTRVPVDRSAGVDFTLEALVYPLAASRTRLPREITTRDSGNANEVTRANEEASRRALISRQSGAAPWFTAYRER
jgi:hypothetical protein